MNRSRGFTLMELVLVMVLTGILAAFAIPRFADRTGFDERGYFEELAAAVRYAHQHAVSSGCHVQAVITPAGYQLNRPAATGSCTGLSFAATVDFPMSNDVFSGTTPAGVTVGGVPLTVVFNPDGSTDLASATATVSISTFSFVIYRDSGFLETP